MTDRLSNGRALTIAVGAISVISILALVIALISQSNANEARTRTAAVAAQQAADRAAQAKALAAANQEQAQKLRDSVCSLLVDVGQAHNLTTATSDFGRKLIGDASRSAQIAGCPR